MSKIVLIEDDLILCETLRYNLEREGYAMETAHDGIEGLELARSTNPDLVVLDVMLPRLDGFSVCRILRHERATPIMMLTARGDELDRVTGFEMGADDYVVKPFSLAEFIARVRVNLRRSPREADGLTRDVLEVGDLRVDTGSRRATRNGQMLSLTQKEFDLLACLMHQKGIALSRELLLERVWGFDFSGDPRTVDVHVRWLREKIEDDPSNPKKIQTVRGIGYRFEPINAPGWQKG
jgi:DNA-binding response OmpR family regulator